MSARLKPWPLVRELDSGVTAPLRKSDMRHAAREISDLCTEQAPDAIVHVPVATLRLHEETTRSKLLEELVAAGVDLAPFLVDGPKPAALVRKQTLAALRTTLRRRAARLGKAA